MKIRKKLKVAVKKSLGPGTRKFKIAKKTALKIRIIDAVPIDVRYAVWVERTEPYSWSANKKLEYQPLVSIVVPVFNPPAKYFMPMIYSVIDQTYGNWELILVNASSNKNSRQQTERTQYIDKRIKIIDIENEGIAANTNAGIKESNGEFIALLDHDDLLAPQAIYEMILSIQDNQTVGLIYSDEDKVSGDGTERYDPFFKPDWSPQLLREVNYINHFSMIRKDVLKTIGFFRKGFEGAQDYDLYLRVIDENNNVVHVPKVLYHWRAAETSTASDFKTKYNILASGIRALKEHLSRNDIEAEVTAIDKQPGYYKVTYHVVSTDKIAIIIMPTMSREQYKKLIKLYIDKTQIHNYDLEFFINLDKNYLKDHKRNASLVHLKSSDPVQILKEVHSVSSAKTFIVVNSGVIPFDKSWIDYMVGPLIQDPKIGLVTPLITDNFTHRIFDSGLVKVNNTFVDIFNGYKVTEHTYFGNSNYVRNIDTISGRCFSIRSKSIEDFVNSFDGNNISPKKINHFLTSKNLEACINSFAKFKFVGELKISNPKTQLFNENLLNIKPKFAPNGLLNVPEFDDE